MHARRFMPGREEPGRYSIPMSPGLPSPPVTLGFGYRRVSLQQEVGDRRS